MSVADSIDIVIVNCNNGERLKSCIKSVKDNTKTPYRLIVVDQNSKDGTKEWLQGNVGHVILDRKRNGRADGRNKGLKVTRSEWVAMIDADIYIDDKDWLDKMWNFTIDRRIGLIETEIRVNRSGAFEKRYSGLSFSLLRRSCLDEVGSFDRSILQGYEYDWLARFEWSRWMTAYCQGVKVINTTARGMAGCLEDNSDHLKADVLKSIGFKFNMDFLELTLFKNINRRNSKSKQLITEVKNGNCDSGNADA